MVGTESKRCRIVGRVADGDVGRRVVAGVQSLGQEQMIDVAGACAVSHCRCVHDDREIAFPDDVAGEAVAHSCMLADWIAVVARDPDILIGEMDERTLIQISEKAFGIAPVGGDGTGVVDLEGVVGAGLEGWPSETCHIAGVEGRAGEGIAGRGV